MIYETFLFTRNQKRDFTAFIRPKDLTNKEVSTIASALNNVNNIADLSSEWPALYSFPIGQYCMLLRHHDSGRTHAGRNIGVVEGIAVKRTLQRHYALAVPHFVAQQQTVLAIENGVRDIEMLEISVSEEHDWPDVQADEQVNPDDELIEMFAERLEEERLFLPFTQDGRAILMAALNDPRLRRAFFAFGTNSEVMARFQAAEIDMDIVSYFNTTLPGLRSRETNEITTEMTDFVGELPPRPPGRIPVELDADYPTEVLPHPREVRKALEREHSHPENDPLGQYDAGDEAMLTPREMRRRERQQQAEMEDEQPSPEESRGWLIRLIGRLLGHR